MILSIQNCFSWALSWAYSLKTRHGERRYSKYVLISEYLRCKYMWQKIECYGTFKVSKGVSNWMYFEIYDKADIKTWLPSWTENDCTVLGDLVCDRKHFFHRKQGSFVKTRRLRSLYVERKMTILWHMIICLYAFNLVPWEPIGYKCKK